MATQEETILDNARIQLKIEGAVNNDELLRLLVKRSINSLLIYIGETVLPAILESVCEEITCVLYRKVGIEGITSETVDVVSYTYTENALTSYLPMLNKYIENRDKVTSKKVKFY